MKRKIIPFLLALVLMLSMYVPAAAANSTCRRICTIQNGRIVCRTVCSEPAANSCAKTCKITCTNAGCKLTCTNDCESKQAPTAQTQTAPVTQTPAASSASDFEKAVCDLVNQERAKYGLAPLTLRSDLCDGARAKSQDMRTKGYFAHQSPTYGSPFDMMKRFGISYSYAGENIAYGYATPEAVMRAWMNSEGHRANILKASFTAIGVGYVASGNYWTQWFVG